MPYDPKEVYKKLALLLGGTKDTGPSRGEYYDVPGVGNIRVGGYQRNIPVSAGGWNPKDWDAMEIWNKSPVGSEKNPQPRYAQGEIPDWVKGAGELFRNSAAKGADSADLQGLAAHWLQGVGVDPFYQKAHDAMPSWVKEYLQGIMGGYLPGGATAKPQ